MSQKIILDDMMTISPSLVLINVCERFIGNRLLLKKVFI